MANRLLIVANRLPVTVQREEDQFVLRESSGEYRPGDTIWVHDYP